ncbi:MAG: acyltransferase [Ignavibacteria bacterium]|jgi:acetyltransferase-like isoleucine patch superfamily enzyme
MIGYKNVGVFDEKYSRTILELRGKIIFEGNAFIGHGSKICVNESGILKFGKNTTISAESSIICYKSISFGNDCLISWENLFLDTDFHSIYDSDNNRINNDDSIIIENNVWIGCRCSILKGTHLKNYTIVAPHSLISRNYNGENQIIGGVPAMILKKGVSWKQ